MIILLLGVSLIANANPKILVEHGFTLNGYARARVINESRENLACYMAIDGYKIKYVLPPLNTSRWFTATDKRYNHTNFSTWCDYLVLHPEYENYRL